MATKWRPGSAGEKEAKEQKIITAFLGLVTIGVLLILFVIPNEVRTNVKASPLWLNILGGVLVAGSGGFVVKGFTSTDDTRNHVRWWAVTLALGILTAAGFFGYTY